MSDEINKAIAETICSDQAGDFVAEFLEIGIDSILKDGLVKDIPILGTVAKIYDFTSNISNRLFANKLLTVLGNFGKLTEEEKTKVAKSFAKVENQKLGEHLLLITEKLESYEKAAIYGKIFRALLTEKISRTEFELMSHAVLSLFLSDAKILFLPPIEIQKQNFNSTVRLYHLSLFECPLEIIDENGSELNGKKYCLSELGVKFINISFGKNEKYVERDGRGAYYKELGLT